MFFDDSDNSPMFVEKEFTECCDDHDICYDTCLEDKDMCDIRFEMKLECESIVQRSAKRWSPDLVNFVTALAYHISLSLPIHSRNLGTTF